MDKGIRPFCNALFVEKNELRRRGLMTNTAFRKAVMAECMEQFGITLASAATHYNHAFITVKGLNAEIVSGLGRAEDKKGGRKKKVQVVAEVAPVAPTNFFPVGGFLLLPGPVQECVAAAAGGIGPDEGAPDQAPNDSDLTPDTGPEQTAFTVCKKSDGSVVAEGLSFADAKVLVERAAAQKKAKLYFV